TSGGKTESSFDWTRAALPYLVSVPDPYDDISPYHSWGPVPMTARSVVKALKLTGPVLDATTVPNAAGRVAQLNLVTPLDAVPVAGTKLRAALGLRSTWFSVGVLSLAAPSPNAPVVYGSPVTLGGTIRGLTGVTLEQRAAGGAWEAVGPVAPGPVKLTQKPAITTDYRLATATAAAGSVRIRVAAVAAAAPAAAFTPTDPLAAKQWHLQDDHAFDFWAEPPATLAPVKVAIVDSGVDCSLPDFQGRIADKKSFVGGDACVDTQGH